MAAHLRPTKGRTWPAFPHKTRSTNAHQDLIRPKLQQTTTDSQDKTTSSSSGNSETSNCRQFANWPAPSVRIRPLWRGIFENRHSHRPARHLRKHNGLFSNGAGQKTEINGQSPKTIEPPDIFGFIVSDFWRVSIERFCLFGFSANERIPVQLVWKMCAYVILWRFGLILDVVIVPFWNLKREVFVFFGLIDWKFLFVFGFCLTSHSKESLINRIHFFDGIFNDSTWMFPNNCKDEFDRNYFQ